MTRKRWYIGIVAGALMILVIAGGGVGCLGGSESSESSGTAESDEHGSSESGEGGEGGGEHGGSSESGEGGEESNTQYALSDMLDEVRAGARLILSYDSTANAFNGTVENTTGATLRRVRVEVHLSNGIELGPTTPVDMAPGQVIEVALPGSSEPFTSWSAHPEAG